MNTLTNIEKYNIWLQKVDCPNLRAELMSISGDTVAIDNAFFKDLTFGTGGLRGELGVGTACLNIYTIRKATQGVADYMHKQKLKSVAISYDSRINSDLFARTAAEVFAKNGISTFISRELMPTPYLSYMVRTLKCDMGVMVTASHNPAKYNGYKVYDCNGCQVTDAAAGEILDFIELVDAFEVKTDTFDEYVDGGAVMYASDKLEQQYLGEVLKQSAGKASGLRVVYTPLNGAGYRLVPTVLRAHGVSELIEVAPQAMPDGNFTTCPYPNPEKGEALKLGLEVLKKTGADLLIATDPDADRMGLALKCNCSTGAEFRLLSGNETGILIADYLLARRKELDTLTKNPIIIKTIVSSPLIIKLASKYGASVVDVLTGFKYIGEYIKGLEHSGQSDRFIFGFEESYGYLAGTYVRDKDAVVASILASEMAAYYKGLGISLCDKIKQIYDEFGYYQHKLMTYEFKGATGFSKMQGLLAGLRANLPSDISGFKVIKIIDYMTQTEFNLPKSDVLSFDMQGGAQLIIRPSGTEPLLKAYLTAAQDVEKNAATFERLAAYLGEVFG